MSDIHTNTHTHLYLCIHVFNHWVAEPRYPSPFLCVNIRNVYTQRAANMKIIFIHAEWVIYCTYPISCCSLPHYITMHTRTHYMAKNNVGLHNINNTTHAHFNVHKDTHLCQTGSQEHPGNETVYRRPSCLQPWRHLWLRLRKNLISFHVAPHYNIHSPTHLLLSSSCYTPWPTHMLFFSPGNNV